MPETPAPFADCAEPLYGHTSPETAIVVENYPYGFRERTTIRYWQETRAEHGVRFVSQTLNPRTGRWNKPRADVYRFVGQMYRNADGHVRFGSLSGYVPHLPAVAFVRTFPRSGGLDRLLAFALCEIDMCRNIAKAHADGWSGLTFPDGTRLALRDGDQARNEAALESWETVAREIRAGAGGAS